MTSRQFLLMATAGTAFLLGCSDSMSPDAYGHLWREEVAKYRALDKNPDDGSGDREAEAGKASQIARQIRALADEMHDWKAPEQFAELQDETYIFYRGQSDSYNGYAEALGNSDSDKVASAAAGINNFAGEHQQKIANLISHLRSGSDQFQATWAQVLADAPKNKGG
jgi:hypothetical protein